MEKYIEYRHLGNAIILQAVQDYKAAKATLDKNFITKKGITAANKTINEVESFLKSKYADMICTALDISKVLSELGISV